MAISFRRYVDITSGVGAGVRVPGRDLVGRIFSVNVLIPADTVVEFTEAAEVAAFFGSFSEEYRREKARLARRAEQPVAWDAPQPATNPHRGVGRNDPCPCGSGKKYKKCCGA